MDVEVDKPRGPMTLLLTSHAFRNRVAFVVIVTPILYVLSFGPACWMTTQNSLAGVDMQMPPGWMRIYWPVGLIVGNPQSPANRLFSWWMMLGVRKGQMASVPARADGSRSIVIGN